MLDLTNGVLVEWAKVPKDALQNLVKILFRGVEAVIATRSQANSELMPMVLESDVQQVI